MNARGQFLLAGAAVIGIAAGLTLLTEREAFAQIRAALTKNVDEHWRTPWETRTQFLPNAGGCYFSAADCVNYIEGPSTAIFDVRPVPAGKRWVIQTITVALVNGLSRTNAIEIGTPRGGIVFDGIKWSYGGPFQPGSFAGAGYFSTGVNLVFGPGETPFVRITGSPSLVGYSVVHLSGYLIDAAN